MTDRFFRDLSRALEPEEGYAEAAYTRLANKRDPYDELVYILLTVMTRSQPRLDAAFDGLLELRDGGGWSELLHANVTDIDAVLRPLGLVRRRRGQLLGLIGRVNAEMGDSLAGLRELPTEDALTYLTTLPGVGVKTAKCVLMYGFGRAVLPVDVHVLRVTKRLGVVPQAATWSQVDADLERSVPDDLKFELHVALVLHGRYTCQSRTPKCSECRVSDICPSAGTPAGLRRDFVS